MKSRLFHVIVICGAALGASTPGCTPGTGEMQSRNPDPQDRCKLPNGRCNEHCRPLGLGQCLDPCFVHTTTCHAECIRPDGSCGWPPTK